MKGKRNYTEALIGYILMSVGWLAALIVMSTFAALVVAKQESAQAVPQILTAIGIVGLMAAICVNYAPILEQKEQREVVVRCAEWLLLASISLIFGLFVKYGVEIVGQNIYVKESKDLADFIEKNGLLCVKGFFLLGVIFAWGGVNSLTLHLVRRQRLDLAIPPIMRRIMLWLLLLVILIFAYLIGKEVVLHLWRWAWSYVC